MIVSRRSVLKGAAALSLAGITPSWAASDKAEVLKAISSSAQLLPKDYPATPIWGYDGLAPGPTIRMRKGERVVRQFSNELPQASTIHWHGVRIANAMDGVPELTQEAVQSGDRFLYDFVAPDAGTYWYHSHNRTWEQMARGLYGPLIVEEDVAPEVDRDEVLLIDDWRLTDQGQIDDNFGTLMDWSHAGRLGNWLTVNGVNEPQYIVNRHDRLRLRLVNVANARIFPLALKGLDGWVVALDGQPLDRPQPLSTIVLAPAQRVDLIVDVLQEPGEEAVLSFQDGDASYAIAFFAVEGEARKNRLPSPTPLPSNNVPMPLNIGDVQIATLRMEGGAMSMMGGAMMGGRMMDMRQLVQAGRVWSFNGQVDMPDAPFVAASQGETVRISMVNDTVWPHAMHLHGHHFRQVGNGNKLGPLRDTLLVEPRETAEIAFVADNPGKWLLHCHMLEHSAGGMMTWIEVAA